MQRRSSRFVLNRYKQTTSVTNLLDLGHLGWTSLESRQKIARLTMMYKILNNMAQEDFGRLHKTQEPKIRAPTKRDWRAHSKQLARVQCLRNCRRHSFLPRTIPDWNDSLTEAVAGVLCLFVCLLACLLVCLFFACLFVCMFACLTVCLLACSLTCLFACLLDCLLACSLAC